MLRIIVDFNNLTPDGEKVLIAQNREIDKEIAPKLKDGLRVLLHEVGDFEVEALVESIEIGGET